MPSTNSKKEPKRESQVQNSPSTERRNAKLKQILGPKAPFNPSPQLNRGASQTFIATRSLHDNSSNGPTPVHRTQSHTIGPIRGKERGISPFPSPSSPSSDSSSESISSSNSDDSNVENSPREEKVEVKPVRPVRPPLPEVPVKKSNVGNIAGTRLSQNGKVDRTLIENQMFKKMLEEKKNREVALKKELEKFDMKSWNEHVKKLNQRIKELESANSKQEVQTVEPIEQTQTPQASPVEIELEEKKRQIEVLEKKNLLLRDNFDLMEKISRKNQTEIEGLNMEVERLRNDSNVVRKEGAGKRKQTAFDNGELYVVIGEFVGEKEGDLSIQPDDLIEITKRGSDGWWEGYNFTTFATGVFPSTFVNKFVGDLREREGRKVVGKFDYDAQADGEFSFYAGDEIIVFQENSNGWWFGLHVLSRSKGLFPSNFVS
eukprot:TRINITY_DN656_c0_g1_i1.p1 TRINITY_DN656_c0_g1~~TRINITY_DN656_c0_g1_i1.p1  ORF type:complete len:431 (+),score=186.92 TRINITY_DN656_c0_g1_i1:57-1349(+)